MVNLVSMKTFTRITLCVCVLVIYVNGTLPFNTQEHTHTKRWSFGADPEQYMNTTGIIAYHGYPVEEYNVTTEDGYIITIQRIPHGIKKYEGKKRRVPALLMPGMTCTSAIWVFNVPDKNLAYMLADAGHDVWLGNFRGSSYGLSHANLTTNDYVFWNFSFHEMGYYDVPAITDFVLQKTGAKEVNYVGQSMGCTFILVTLSTRPEYNKKVRVAALFGPAAGMKYNSSPSQYGTRIGELLMSFCPSCSMTAGTISTFVRTHICAMPAFYDLCKFGVYITGGFDAPDKINISRLPVYLTHFPDTTSSIMNYLHYAQLATDGFRMFDYGENKNYIAYGEASAPAYKLNQITSPMALFWNEVDGTTTILDVQYLFTQLDGHVIDCEIPGKFAHRGYIIRMDANRVVYDRVLKLFDDDTDLPSLIYKEPIYHSKPRSHSALNKS